MESEAAVETEASASSSLDYDWEAGWRQHTCPCNPRTSRHQRFSESSKPRWRGVNVECSDADECIASVDSSLTFRPGRAEVNDFIGDLVFRRRCPRKPHHAKSPLTLDYELRSWTRTESASRLPFPISCSCPLARNMRSPNMSVTCRASHALSTLLLGAVAQNLLLRDEKEDEDNMYTALVSKAAPGREDARHPKCGPSSGNSAQSVERHAEIVPCDKRA